MWKIVCVILAAIAVTACAPFHPYVDHSQQRYYIVQPNDNVYSIAFALEISPEQLRHANPWINPANITPGMRLSVPRYALDDNYTNGYKIHAEKQIHDSDRVEFLDRHSGYIWPLNRVEVSSNYGYRRGHLHAGIDLRAPRGTRIYASGAGTVIFSGYQRDYGHIVVIDHGNGIETAYAHNRRNIAKKGQRVKQGQVIATVGRTGNATGYHVHFEFRRHGKAVNPTRHVHAGL